MTPNDLSEHRSSVVLKRYQRQGETQLNRLRHDTVSNGQKPKIDYLTQLIKDREAKNRVTKFDMQDVLARAKASRKETVKEEAFLSHLVEFRNVPPETKMSNWKKKP